MKTIKEKGLLKSPFWGYLPQGKIYFRNISPREPLLCLYFIINNKENPRAASGFWKLFANLRINLTWPYYQNKGLQTPKSGSITSPAINMSEQSKRDDREKFFRKFTLRTDRLLSSRGRRCVTPILLDTRSTLFHCTTLADTRSACSNRSFQSTVFTAPTSEASNLSTTFVRLLQNSCALTDVLLQRLPLKFINLSNLDFS